MKPGGWLNEDQERMKKNSFPEWEMKITLLSIPVEVAEMIKFFFFFFSECWENRKRQASVSLKYLHPQEVMFSHFIVKFLFCPGLFCTSGCSFNLVYVFPDKFSECECLRVGGWVLYARALFVPLEIPKCYLSFLIHKILHLRCLHYNNNINKTS